jgi:hypothetical protein
MRSATTETGLPEVQTWIADPRESLRTSTSPFGDIVERHAVANAAALRRFVRQLMNTPAGLFSIRKLHADGSRGLGVGSSLMPWLEHLEDVYVSLACRFASSGVCDRATAQGAASTPGWIRRHARRSSADQDQLFGHLFRATAPFL